MGAEMIEDVKPLLAKSRAKKPLPSKYDKLHAAMRKLKVGQGLTQDIPKGITPRAFRARLVLSWNTRPGFSQAQFGTSIIDDDTVLIFRHSKQEQERILARRKK